MATEVLSLGIKGLWFNTPSVRIHRLLLDRLLKRGVLDHYAFGVRDQNLVARYFTLTAIDEIPTLTWNTKRKIEDVDSLHGSQRDLGAPNGAKDPRNNLDRSNEGCEGGGSCQEPNARS